MSSDPDFWILDPAGDVLLLLTASDDCHDPQPPQTGFEASQEDETNEITAVSDASDHDSPTLYAGGDDTLRADTLFDSNHSSSGRAFTDSTSYQRISRTIKIRVSSRHLALASPMFCGLFDVAAKDELVQHTAEIPLQDDDPSALRILLNIVHGFHSKVPRSMKRKLLYKVVSLIDKYEFQEMKLFTDMWYCGLRPSFPHNMCNEIASWIYICHELEKSADFEHLTKVVILQSNGDLRVAESVRIPYWIIDDLRSRRSGVLNEILSSVADLVKQYEGPQQTCFENPNCDALSLGTLVRGLKGLKLYPVPEPATVTISVQDLLSRIRTIDIVTACDQYGGYGNFSHGENRHLDRQLRESLSQIESQVRGLNLERTPVESKAEVIAGLQVDQH